MNTECNRKQFEYHALGNRTAGGRISSDGKVWFFAGHFFPGSCERSCTLPEKKAMFFPGVNSLYFPPEDGETVVEARVEATDSFVFGRLLARRSMFDRGADHLLDFIHKRVISNQLTPLQ